MLASAVVPVRGSPLMSTGPRHGQLGDLRMVAVPRLDLQPVHQPPAEVTDHRGVRDRAQPGVARQALEQHLEAITEVPRPEVAQARDVRGLGQESVARGVPAGHRTTVRIELLGDAAEPVAPADPTGTGERRPPGRVADRAPGRAGDLLHDHVDVDAEELAEVGAVLLHAHGFVSAPVDDGSRHTGGVEQWLELRADVVVVDGAVGHRIPACPDRLAGGHGIEVPDREPALVAVGRAHARDRDRQVERAGAIPRHSLPRDLRHRVRGRGRGHRVAQGIVLPERVPRIGMRLVDGDRRHHQGRLRRPAVLEDEPGALGVHAERTVVVVGAEIGREVQEVGEVRRQVAEVAVRVVDGTRGHAEGVDLLAVVGSPNRAMPQTSLSATSDRASPYAIRPAGPVIRIFSSRSTGSTPPVGDDASRSVRGAC